DVVDLGAAEIRSAGRIDEHADAVVLVDGVVLVRPILEAQRVLQPRAAAADHGHPQPGLGRAPLTLQKDLHASDRGRRENHGLDRHLLGGRWLLVSIGWYTVVHHLFGVATPGRAVKEAFRAAARRGRGP